MILYLIAALAYLLQFACLAALVVSALTALWGTTANALRVRVPAKMYPSALVGVLAGSPAAGLFGLIGAFASSQPTNGLQMNLVLVALPMAVILVAWLGRRRLPGEQREGADSAALP